MVPDAPAVAAAAEMPLVRSAGIVPGTFPAAPGAAAPGEEKIRLVVLFVWAKQNYTF